MSIFGEPLPFEDDTATSLIRRVGFPPDRTYAQMPEMYLCPCCTEFSKQQERDRLLREAREVKEAEHRRLMQLDIFEERARPLPSGEPRRKMYRRIMDEDEVAETAPNVPPPPSTIDDLRRAKRDHNVPKLVVTVHHGRNVSAEAEDPISVIVRCGAFEGQTEKVFRGKEIVTPWEELFEFPYINSAESLEVLVVNEALPELTDKLVGGVVLPSDALHDRNHGDQEPLPVMPVDSMNKGYGVVRDGPLGTIVASWYVRDGNDKIDGEAVEQQTLSVPLNCTFVARHVYQYTDHGAEPYPGGILCVLRDTDDNCSESVLYTPGPQPEPSLSPYYSKEGFYYLSPNPSQLMQLNTEKKLGHILVCVPKQEESNTDEEELLVIGAVPLEFERLYNKGSAVLLIESKSKEDALWGEISIEWLNKPLDEEDPHPASLEVQKESLFVTIVRGLNLVRRDGNPVAQGYVSVATGDLEGTTVEAPAVDDTDGNHVINWNQEVRFIEVEPDQRDIEVHVYEGETLVSVGMCVLEEKDEGVVIIQMHQAANATEDAGEIVVSYKRLHIPGSGDDATYKQHHAGDGVGVHDEEDEEDEEQEEPRRFEDHLSDNEKVERIDTEDEEEDPQVERDNISDGANRSVSEEKSHQLNDGQEELLDAGESVEGLHDASSTNQEEGNQQRQTDSEGQQHPLDSEEITQEKGYQHEPQSHREQIEDEQQLYKTAEAESVPKSKPLRQDEQLQEETAEVVGGATESEPLKKEKQAKKKIATESEPPKKEKQAKNKTATESEAHKQEERSQEKPVEEQAATKSAAPTQEERSQEKPVEEQAATKYEAPEQEERSQEKLAEEQAATKYEAPKQEERSQEKLAEEQAATKSEAPTQEERPQEKLAEEQAATKSEAPTQEERSQEKPVEEQAATKSAAPKQEERPQEGASEEKSVAYSQPPKQNKQSETAAAGEDVESQQAQTQSQQDLIDAESEEYRPDEDVEEPYNETPAAYSTSASGRRRRRPSWTAQSSKSAYQQPWYPSGSPETEQHIPFSKTTLSKKNMESIYQLEKCKSRIEEESVRRSCTSRRSSTRGLSPSSQ